MLIFLLQLFCFLSASITVKSPDNDVLKLYYISEQGAANSCDSGLNINWYADKQVTNGNNQIKVTSSVKSSGRAPVCYKYGAYYYGANCPSCAVPLASNPTDFPQYSGASVTIFIPHLAMVEEGDLSTLTSFTLYVGVDEATGSNNPNNYLQDTEDYAYSLTVYIDNIPPSGSVNDFKIQRGDKEIYVTEFNTAYLTDNGSGIYQARFYYGECGVIPDLSLPYQTFLLTDEKPWVIKNVENGFSYTLKATILDKAGNEYVSDNIANPSNLEDVTSTCVTPTSIVGFLNGDERCFIATEVFGTRSIKTNYFRKFRDKYLLQSQAGSYLVNTYYLLSPCFVKLLKLNPLLKLIIKNNLELIYKGLKLCKA